MTVLTKSPTATFVVTAGWNNPTYAYSSDDLRTNTSNGNAEQGYKNYGFSLEGMTIEKVEVGLEGFSDTNAELIDAKVSWDGGTAYSLAGTLDQRTESLVWYDVTNLTEWTPEKLSDVNLRTAIKYRVTGGGGCYDLESEFGLWRKYKMIKAGKVKVGDILSGWNGRVVKAARVVKAEIHEGKFEMLRVIAQNLNDKHSLKDCLVTPEHPLPYSEIKFKPFTSIPKVKIRTKPAKQFKLGDFVFGWIDSRPMHFECYKVIGFERMIRDGCIDIRATTRWLLGHFLLQRKMVDSGKVDWLPVRVTYSEVPLVSARRRLLGVGK